MDTQANICFGASVFSYNTIERIYSWAYGETLMQNKTKKSLTRFLLLKEVNVR